MNLTKEELVNKYNELNKKAIRLSKELSDTLNEMSELDHQIHES